MTKCIHLTCALAAALFSMSCSGGDTTSGTDDEAGQEQSSTMSDGTPKLQPVRQACITYEMTGQLQSGTTIRCHRKHGYESYEIQDTTIGFAGVTQQQNTHNITIGDTIYMINLTDNSATKMLNPMYESVVKSVTEGGSENAGQAFLTAMGFAPTSESKTIAGEKCDVYDSSMAGQACFTSDYLMLEMTIMGMGQIATEIDRSSGGPDENYSLFEGMEITDGPDLATLMGDMPEIEEMGELMEQIGPAVEQLAPAMEQVGPAIEELGPALEKLGPALEELGPALQDLQSAFEQLESLNTTDAIEAPDEAATQAN